MTFRPLRAAVVAAAVLSAVCLALLALASAAPAAQLEADFHLNGTRTAPTGETLADLGNDNAFAAEAVDGGAVPRQVLTFPAGGGISLPAAGLAESGSYSVALLFRVDRRQPGGASSRTSPVGRPTPACTCATGRSSSSCSPRRPARSNPARQATGRRSW